jgi:hypothetical protein
MLRLLTATLFSAISLPAVAQVMVVQADRVLAEPGRAPLGPTRRLRARP